MMKSEKKVKKKQNLRYNMSLNYVFYSSLNILILQCKVCEWREKGKCKFSHINLGNDCSLFIKDEKKDECFNKYIEEWKNKKMIGMKLWQNGTLKK